MSENKLTKKTFVFSALLVSAVAIFVLAFISYNEGVGINTTITKKLIYVSEKVKADGEGDAASNEMVQLNYALGTKLLFLVFDKDDNNLKMIVPENEEKICSDLRKDLKNSVTKPELGSNVKKFVNNPSGLESPVKGYLELDKSKIADIKLVLSLNLFAKVYNYFFKNDYDVVENFFSYARNTLQNFEKSKDEDFFIINYDEKELDVYSITSKTNEVGNVEWKVTAKKYKLCFKTCTHIKNEDMVSNLLSILLKEPIKSEDNEDLVVDTVTNDHNNINETIENKKVIISNQGINATGNFNGNFAGIDDDNNQGQNLIQPEIKVNDESQPEEAKNDTVINPDNIQSNGKGVIVAVENSTEKIVKSDKKEPSTIIESEKVVETKDYLELPVQTTLDKPIEEIKNDNVNDSLNTVEDKKNAEPENSSQVIQKSTNETVENNQNEPKKISESKSSVENPIIPSSEQKDINSDTEIVAEKEKTDSDNTSNESDKSKDWQHVNSNKNENEELLNSEMPEDNKNESGEGDSGKNSIEANGSKTSFEISGFSMLDNTKE